MILSEIISSIDTQNDEAVIYVKKIDGKFLPLSEAVLLNLTDEEIDLPTKEISERYCPGFDYFLEVFLVKDMVEDMKKEVGFKSLEQQVNRIIHYAEFDA
jgi:hypothetical protein